RIRRTCRVSTLILIAKGEKSKKMRGESIVRLRINEVLVGRVWEGGRIGLNVLIDSLSADREAIRPAEDNRSTQVVHQASVNVLRNPGWGKLGVVRSQPDASITQEVVPVCCRLILPVHPKVAILARLLGVARYTVEFDRIRLARSHLVVMNGGA